MISLTDYILESMHELYHFTAYNLVDIMKDDEWIASIGDDDENKDQTYIPTTSIKEC